MGALSESEYQSLVSDMEKVYDRLGLRPPQVIRYSSLHSMMVGASLTGKKTMIVAGLLNNIISKSNGPIMSMTPFMTRDLIDTIRHNPDMQVALGAHSTPITGGFTGGLVAPGSFTFAPWGTWSDNTQMSTITTGSFSFVTDPVVEYVSRFSSRVVVSVIHDVTVWMVCYESQIHIADMKVHYDAQGREHYDGGPVTVVPAFDHQHEKVFISSVERPLYGWHGTTMPLQYADVSSEHWKPDWILREGNQEVRRALMEGIGMERVLSHFEATLIDGSRADGQLYRLNVALDGEVCCLLKVLCPSTGRHYVLRVPPNIRTAREARRWTLGTDAQVVSES